MGHINKMRFEIQGNFIHIQKMGRNGLFQYGRNSTESLWKIAKCETSH